jgi:DNA primase
MASNQIEEVKNKTDIVSLISEYIEVKKAGRNYKANCPFHGEKTPSFMITPELQMYKCFGCGRHGDCFTFLEEHEGMEFSESLKYLAKKCGVTLTLIKNEESSEKEKIIEINKSALNFYNYALHDHPQGKKVLEYLAKNRGLNKEMIQKFKLGYSPESYDALANYLIGKKKFNKKDLESAGLLVGRGIDRFRGRLIFPLSDHRGNIVGFAGRILPWAVQDIAKYINSPDTPAYHKSHILYGMDITKSEIRDQKYAVIVEGEIDMISSYQAGIKNVIAIKGSALTEDQLRLIARFAKKIVLCLDSDFAGDEAAKRGAILAVNMDFEVKVAHIEGFKDPDEIARNNPDQYKKSIENAVDIWDFLIDSIFKKYDTSTGGEKSKISRDVVPLLRLIEDKIVQSSYIESVARRLSVPVAAVMAEVEKVVTQKNKEITNLEYKKINKDRRQLLEEKLLVNAIQKNKEILFENDIKELISSEFILKIINYLEKNKFPLPKELEEGYAEMVLENSEDDDVDLIVKELTPLFLKQKKEEISNKLKMNEDDTDLIKEFDILSKKLSSL